MTMSGNTLTAVLKNLFFLLAVMLPEVQAFGLNFATIKALDVAQILTDHGYSSECLESKVLLRQDITHMGVQSSGIFERECSGVKQLIKTIQCSNPSKDIDKYKIQINYAESLGLIDELSKNNINIVSPLNSSNIFAKAGEGSYEFFIFTFVEGKNLQDLTEKLGQSSVKDFYQNEKLNVYRKAYRKFGQAMAIMYTKSMHSTPEGDPDFSRLFCIADAQKKNVMYDEKSDSFYFVDTVDESIIKTLPEGTRITFPISNLCSSIVQHLSGILPRADSRYHMQFAGKDTKYFNQYLAFFFESFKSGYFTVANKSGVFTINEDQFDRLVSDNMAGSYHYSDSKTYSYKEAVNDYKQWVSSERLINE